MNKFTSPLDNIRIASPCSADWNQMYGNDRKRFCGDCRLNVYNLSDMTRDEAESFLMASEGRVCVRFFRRADGTVLTRNCPVGWRAVKQRVSRAAMAVFSVVVGFVCGLFALRAVDSAVSMLPLGSVPPVELPAEPVWREQELVPIAGEVEYPGLMGRPMYPAEFEGRVDLREFRRVSSEKKGPNVTVVGEKDFSRY
jgi:hypothetical protein